MDAVAVDQLYPHRWKAGEYRKYPTAKAGIVLDRGWEKPREAPVKTWIYHVSICTGSDSCPDGGIHGITRRVSEMEIRLANLNVKQETKREAWRLLRKHFIKKDKISVICTTEREKGTDDGTK